MPDIQHNAISEKLKVYFKEMGITQDVMADRLKVSQSAVWSQLNGKAFGKKQAEKWGNEFGLNPIWLYAGEGEMLKADKNSVQSQPKEYEKLPAGSGMMEFLMDQNRSLEKIVHDQNKIMIDQNDIIKAQLARITDLEAEIDRIKNASTAPAKGAGCAAAS